VVVRKGVIRRWLVWKKSDSREFLTSGPIFVIASISAVVLASMGRWFVGFYIPEKEAITHFTVASYMVQMSVLPLEVAGYAIVPIICAKAKLTDFNRQARVYLLLSGVVLMPVIFAVGWYVGRPLMLLYKHDVYDAAVPLLLIMLIGRTAYVFQILSFGFFYKFTKPTTMLYLNTSSVALGVLLNIWLVPKFYAQGHGALGAAWAMGLAIGFQGVVCAVLLTWKLLWPQADDQPPQCPTTGDLVEREVEGQSDILR
jgi:Na+-driven multidrug efflux pump